MAKKFLTPLNLMTRSSDPSGSEGDLFFNTTEKTLKIHNGSVWVAIPDPSPTPFYEHTHTYDGDVHTINVQNQITFEEINLNSITGEDLPVIIGIDGGNPNSTLTDASLQNLTLLDGGTVGN